MLKGPVFRRAVRETDSRVEQVDSIEDPSNLRDSVTFTFGCALCAERDA